MHVFTSSKQAVWSNLGVCIVNTAASTLTLNWESRTELIKSLRPLSSGDPAGWLLWTADRGLCGCGLKAERPPATDDVPGPD